MAASRKPSVYSYVDYRRFLGDSYAHAKETEYGFSFCVFSRRAGISSSNYLRLVIDGKRNLTAPMATRFAEACGLRGAPAEFFCELVAYNQAETDAEARSWDTGGDSEPGNAEPDADAGAAESGEQRQTKPGKKAGRGSRKLSAKAEALPKPYCPTDFAEAYYLTAPERRALPKEQPATSFSSNLSNRRLDRRSGPRGQALRPHAKGRSGTRRARSPTFLTVPHR